MQTRLLPLAVVPLLVALTGESSEPIQKPASVSESPTYVGRFPDGLSAVRRP
jgi:hypothetical protein